MSLVFQFVVVSAIRGVKLPSGGWGFNVLDRMWVRGSPEWVGIARGAGSYGGKGRNRVEFETAVACNAGSYKGKIRKQCGI